MFDAYAVPRSMSWKLANSYDIKDIASSNGPPILSVTKRSSIYNHCCWPVLPHKVSFFFILAAGKSSVFVAAWVFVFFSILSAVVLWSGHLFPECSHFLLQGHHILGHFIIPLSNVTEHIYMLMLLVCLQYRAQYIRLQYVLTFTTLL